MTITQLKGQTIFALERGETTQMVRQATGAQSVQTFDDPADWQYDNPEMVKALVEAGADMSKVQRIGYTYTTQDVARAIGE